MPSASITLISSPTINGGLPMSVLLPLWPVDSHGRMPACGCHGVGFYCASGRSFRTAATTSTMAALVACESLRSYNRDVCVAPLHDTVDAVGREGGQSVLQLEPTGLRCACGDHRQRLVPKAPRTSRSERLGGGKEL